MSDIEDYFNAQPKVWATQKQERFEHKVLLELLRGLEGKAGLASQLAKDAGDSFGCVWLGKRWPDFPMKLATHKAPKPVAVQLLLKRPDKLPIYRQICELRENYPEEQLGLLFASDGDGLPEMVIHTATHWVPDVKYWRIIIPHLPVLAEETQAHWVVDPLPGFISAFKDWSSWRLNEGTVGGTT